MGPSTLQEAIIYFANADNCREYLIREMALLKRLKVVVVLGRIAMDAYLRARQAERRTAFAFGHGVTHHFDAGPLLLCSYHPSQQNTSTGRLTAAMLHAIFQKARTVIDTHV